MFMKPSDPLSFSLDVPRINKVKETSKEISNYLKETNKILRVSNASADWRGTRSFIYTRLLIS